MFVKFDCGVNANHASKVLNGVPFDTSCPEVMHMRVEMARSDMKSEGGPDRSRAERAPQVYHHQPPPPGHGGRGYQPSYGGMSHPPPLGSDAYSGGGFDGYSAQQGLDSRKRGRNDPGSVDTLVLLGQVEKGFTERQLEDFFMQLPGYVAFRSNERVGGGFVKFVSPKLAQDAIGLAATSGIEAQMARSSMNVGDAGGQDGGGGKGYGGCSVGKGGGKGYDGYGKGYDRGSRDTAPTKRVRNDPPGTIDTLVLLGQVEKGFTERQLEDFFQQVPGFLAFKPNARVGGGFVKFHTPEMAAEAIEIAGSNGIEAQMARSSMGS